MHLGGRAERSGFAAHDPSREGAYLFKCQRVDILTEFEIILEVGSVILYARNGMSGWVGFSCAARGHGTDWLQSELNFAVLQKVHEPIGIFDQDG